MEQNIREIETTRISPNLRMVYSTECIEEMVQCIKQQGQVEPIQISFERNSFKILDGEKRWRACKRLKIKTVKAIIVEPL